jgi:density-regulated protein DRP1
VKKCEEWLQKHHPDMHQQLYSEEAIAANLSALSLEARERAAKDAAKKEAKAALAETRDQERKAAAKVQIKRVERNKRKFVTVVSGLEAHGLDNKKIAKDLGKKFATGSSVTKVPGGIGLEEITVQGDVSEEIMDWLLEVHGKKLPEENIELVEDKKKKAAAA